MSEDETVRLCVQSLYPIDPGNYPGPIHCVAHQDVTVGCVTALYQRMPGTTVTAEERQKVGV